MNLVNMSVVQLEQLAVKAKRLADDLRKDQPSYELAMEAGIRDESYQTVRFGTVAKYSGDVIVTMADGKTWRCVGRGPTGGADWISKQGYIEFFPLIASVKGIDAFDSAVLPVGHKE